MPEPINNEDLLREGECSYPNCIEVAGHTGSHSPNLEAVDPAAVQRGLEELQRRAEDADCYSLVESMEPALARVMVALRQTTGALLECYVCETEGLCLEHRPPAVGAVIQCDVLLAEIGEEA